MPARSYDNSSETVEREPIGGVKWVEELFWIVELCLIHIFLLVMHYHFVYQIPVDWFKEPIAVLGGEAFHIIYESVHLLVPASIIGVLFSFIFRKSKHFIALVVSLPAAWLFLWLPEFEDNNQFALSLSILAIYLGEFFIVSSICSRKSKRRSVKQKSGSGLSFCIKRKNHAGSGLESCIQARMRRPDKGASRVERPKGGLKGERSESSMCLIFLDPSLRWDDENAVNQRFLKH